MRHNLTKVSADTATSPKSTSKVNPREILDQHANTIIEKLIERAISGDPTAIRLCVERIIPRAKPDNGIDFELPDGRLDTGDSMLKITADITKAVADGSMTIDEADKFTGFLKRQRWQIDEAERKKEEEERRRERGW